MQNLHPEYAAIAAFILNIIVHICEHYGIQVPPDTQAALTLVLMWVVIRVAKKFDPPSNEQLVEQIQKNLTKKQDDNDNQQQATAAAIANSIPPAVIVAAAEKQQTLLQR